MRRLLFVPFAVVLRHGMDIVRDRIAVGHTERLRGADGDHARHKHTAVLVQAHRRLGRLEVFLLQAGLNIDESVGQTAGFSCDHRLFINRVAGMSRVAASRPAAQTRAAPVASRGGRRTSQYPMAISL